MPWLVSIRLVTVDMCVLMNWAFDGTFNYFFFAGESYWSIPSISVYDLNYCCMLF